MWQGICLLLLLIEAGAVDADAPSKLHPSTVSVGSYLPPQGSADNVGLASPDGIFNLRIQAWRASPSYYYCMAGVVNFKMDPGSMIWGANNAQPLMVSSTCRLFLSPDGDLFLQYDGNKIAWQTHTAGMGVSNLTLQNSGNLILHTKQGIIVWQSFTQSPAFALTSGMHLTSNITIYSSSGIPNGVTSFNVPGSFAMQLHSHSNLVLFTSSTDPYSRFVYWSSSPTRTGQVSYVALDDTLTFYDSSSLALGSIASASYFPDPPSNSSLRVALLDPSSANLLAFYRSNDEWVQFFNSSISVCENPMYCGNFSLCNMSTGACTCPSGFLQNSARDCQPADTDHLLPLPSCSSSAAHSEEAISYRFVFVNVSFPPQLSAMSSNSVENCTSLCVNSCMCKAALFDPGTRSCSLFSNLLTLPLRADSMQLMLLKMVAKQSHAKKHLAAILVGGICAAALCFICAAAAICFTTKRKRELSSRAALNEEGFLQALPRLPPRYTYKELQVATEGFSRKLGAGAFGAVYEGVLPSGVKIAVKKLEEGSAQSSAQFRAEVASIGSVSHVNLVTLRGFCHEGDERLLVYEHMRNGSLDRWLFKGGEKGNKLGWEKRCKIALDTAKGLAYLHHECLERIVHCDVKPENILLDEEFNAKVGDFGLAKLVGQGHHSFTMTTLKGTRGYLAPEWLHHTTITAKSDVYSFGIVMLELVSGRRCLGSDYGYLPSLAYRLTRTSSSSEGHPNQLQRRDFIDRVPSCSSTQDWAVEEPILLKGLARSQEEVIESKGSFFQSDGDGVVLSFEQPPIGASNQRPLPSSDPLADNANHYGHSSMAALLDPCLSEDSELLPSNLERMIFIGLWCVQPNPAARPSMPVVVQMVEGIVDVPPPPLQNPDWDASTSSSVSHGSMVCSYQSSQQQS